MPPEFTGHLNPFLGWLPVNIEMDVRPAIVREARIRWMEFGREPLAEPFFDHTVARLSGRTPPARRLDTNLETLRRAATMLPAVRPAGFIFHISRCGSTLLANGLKLADKTVVASEPWVLARILSRFDPAPRAELTAHWDATRRELADAYFRVLAHYRTGETERVAIKFPSNVTGALPLIRAWWPDVPCVVIIRDPCEVIVAKQHTSNATRDMYTTPDVARELLGWPEPHDRESMSFEEFLARLTGTLLETALKCAGPGCLVVDYDSLNAGKVFEIGAWFGLDLSGKEEEMKKVFGVYSKDPAKAHRFTSDHEFKRHHTTPAVKAAAHRWAMAAYSELRSR